MQGSEIFSPDPDPAQLKKKSDPDHPDSTLIRNEKKIYIFGG